MEIYVEITDGRLILAEIRFAKTHKDQPYLESVYKPGSVLSNHSSRARVTTGLKQPTRIRRGPRQRIPIWSCSERGLQCHKLLPVARCALTAPFHPYLYQKIIDHRRYIFCCTFRRLAPPRRYLALCPMEPGLSSPDNLISPREISRKIQRRLPNQLYR